MTTGSLPASGRKKYSRTWRIVISLGVSSLLLLLLWGLVSIGDEMEAAASFTETLEQTAWWLASFYIVTSILQTLLRAFRYRSLLKADGISIVPDPWFMFIVTLCRNMFVDMVPARIGEASYVIMLNRAYRVPVSAGISTLFISLVLDILALSLLLLLLVMVSVLSAANSGEAYFNALAASSIIVIAAGFMINAAAPLSQWFSSLVSRTGVALLLRFGRFVAEVGRSIERVQAREILSLTLLQSLGIRVLKYGGLYILFIAVTTVSFPEFTALPLQQILPAFISAEAAASLPLPTFMSFGSYEGGGLLAFSVLGFAAADILMVMFVIHLISQIVDYTLGGLGLLIFLLKTGKVENENTND